MYLTNECLRRFNWKIINSLSKVVLDGNEENDD